MKSAVAHKSRGIEVTNFVKERFLFSKKVFLRLQKFQREIETENDQFPMRKKGGCKIKYGKHLI